MADSIQQYGYGGSALSPRERARLLFGDARRGVGGMVDRTRAGVGSAFAGLREAAKENTLGGVLASQTGPATAAGVMGAIDSTERGKALLEATGGWLKPSTAFAILGIAARGSRLDSSLPRPLYRANTAMLKGMIPVWAYNAGARIPGAVSERMGGSPSLSGAPAAPALAGANPTTERVGEMSSEPSPVPGERTVA